MNVHDDIAHVVYYYVILREKRAKVRPRTLSERVHAYVVSSSGLVIVVGCGGGCVCESYIVHVRHTRLKRPQNSALKKRDCACACVQKILECRNVQTLYSCFLTIGKSITRPELYVERGPSFTTPSSALWRLVRKRQIVSYD